METTTLPPLFLAHSGRVQSLHAAPAQLPPFCLRYNLFAVVVHGHCEVQLQLDCMHLKCLNLQCVDILMAALEAYCTLSTKH